MTAKIKPGDQAEEEGADIPDGTEVSEITTLETEDEAGQEGGGDEEGEEKGELVAGFGLMLFGFGLYKFGLREDVPAKGGFKGIGYGRGVWLFWLGRLPLGGIYVSRLYKDP